MVAIKWKLIYNIFYPYSDCYRIYQTLYRAHTVRIGIANALDLTFVLCIATVEFHLQLVSILFA